MKADNELEHSTKAANPNHSHKRRRGRFADEMAMYATCSRYKAKQAIKLLKEAPEFFLYAAELVLNGQLKLKAAVEIMEEAPGLVPFLVSGALTPADVIAAIQEVRQKVRQLEQLELTFEEEVERSFKAWLSRWPREDRREAFELVAFMPYDAVAELIPQDNLGVEIDPEKKQSRKDNKAMKGTTE